MTRIPSKSTVLKTLTNAGFPMDSIVELRWGAIEIGFLTDGVVEPGDRQRTEQAATVAEELLAWSGYYTGYGTVVLKYGYEPEEVDCMSPYSRHQQ